MSTIAPSPTITHTSYPKPNTEEEFEKFIAATAGRFFVQLDKDGKPDKALKDFVYTVAEPNGVYKEMFGWGNEAEFIIKIRVLKRDKRVLVEKKIGDITVKEYSYVPKHVWDGQNWKVNDEDGEHVLVSSDFDRKFKAES